MAEEIKNTAENTVETVENTPAETTETKEEEKRFTQEEINEIISKRISAERKKWEKKAADDAAEAVRVAQMDAEQRAAHERDKREKELAARERELTARERKSMAREQLSAKGMPATLISAVDISSDEAIEASIETLSKAWHEAVSAETAKKLASSTPKAPQQAQNTSAEEEIIRKAFSRK